MKNRKYSSDQKDLLKIVVQIVNHYKKVHKKKITDETEAKFVNALCDRLSSLVVLAEYSLSGRKSVNVARNSIESLKKRISKKLRSNHENNEDDHYYVESNNENDDEFENMMNEVEEDLGLDETRKNPKKTNLTGRMNNKKIIDSLLADFESGYLSANPTVQEILDRIENDYDISEVEKVEILSRVLEEIRK